MSKAKMPISVEDTTARASRSRHKEASVPQLPPLSINAMTPLQLEEFVPALMRVVIGDFSTRNSSLLQRPHWWPPDVPLWSGAGDRNKEGAFTEAMKKVVRSCYHHLGQGALLSAGKLNDWKTLVGRAQTRKQTLAAGDGISVTGSSELTGSGKKPFMEIYICFFCSKEFSAKDDMRKHQLSCSKRPQELQALDSPPQISKRNNKPDMSHLSPVRLDLSPVSSPTMEQFLHKFHLIPVSKAKRLRASTRRSTEVDCSKIDFSEPETPISPTTPKTPKLLISQLSRDDSGHCKRRLSYRLNEEHSDSESVVSGSSDDTEEKQTPARNKSLLSIDISSLLGQRLQNHLKSDTGISVVTNAESFCKTPVKNQFLEKLRKKENTFPITFKPRKNSTKRPHVHLYTFTKRQRISNFKRLKTGLNRKSRMLAKSLPKCRVVLGRLSKSSLKYWDTRSEREMSKKVPSIFPEGPTFLSEDIDKMLGLKKKNRPPKPERSLSLANVVSEDTNAEVLQQKVALYRSLLSDLSSSKDHSLITISPTKSVSGSVKEAPTIILSPLPPVKDSKLKEHYSHLSSLLQTNSSSSCDIPGKPLTPSSSASSSPDSSQQLSKQTFCQPLKIEIPTQGSPRRPSLRRSFSANSSHGGELSRECLSPDDSVSIITVSSDEDSFINTLCCAGCRERQKCKCTPVKSDLNTSVKPEHKCVFRRRNALGQFLKREKCKQETLFWKRGKDKETRPILQKVDKNERSSSILPYEKKGKEHHSRKKQKLCSLSDGRKSKQLSSLSQGKKSKKLSEFDQKTSKQLGSISDGKKNKQLSSLSDSKKNKQLSSLSDSKKNKQLSSLSDSRKSKQLSFLPESKKIIKTSFGTDVKKSKEHSSGSCKKKGKELSSLSICKKSKSHSPLADDKKCKQASSLFDGKKSKKIGVLSGKKTHSTFSHQNTKSKVLSLQSNLKKSKSLSALAAGKKGKLYLLTVKKSKQSSPQSDDKKSKELSSSSDGKKSKNVYSLSDGKKNNELSSVSDDKIRKLLSSLPGDKKKTKESSVQETKMLKEAEASKKSKESTSVSEEKKSKECSSVASVKKSKELETSGPPSIGQYGLRRQASAPEGFSNTLQRSPSLVKISAVPVKRPSKLGLRSHNSVCANSPVQGIKRQASCSPSKSAMPSPKKSRSDVLP